MGDNPGDNYTDDIDSRFASEAVFRSYSACCDLYHNVEVFGPGQTLTVGVGPGQEKQGGQ